LKIQQIFDKTSKGKRLSFDEAVFLFNEADLLQLAHAADAVCCQKHPEGRATFLIDRNVNYTNICQNQCCFCAFYRPKGHPEAYVLSQKEIEEKIAETIELSGTQVMLQGGINPDLKIDYYTNMFSKIKKKFSIRIHSLSPPEIVHIAESAGISISEALKELIKAGLDSLPGGGAEILVDRVRKRISPRKITVEIIEDRITHLQKVRDLQDRTGGFISFIPWSFQPGNTSLGGKSVSPIEYLRTLSISRLFLDNFPNVQGSWVTQGKDIGQICLSFGANDLGSIMIEENVVRAAGVSHRITVDEMVDLIIKAGKIPAQRDTEFNILKVY
jgi:cyclic dehypoxanthinyl futalosine synthase